MCLWGPLAKENSEGFDEENCEYCFRDLSCFPLTLTYETKPALPRLRLLFIMIVDVLVIDD